MARLDVRLRYAGLRARELTRHARSLRAALARLDAGPEGEFLRVIDDRRALREVTRCAAAAPGGLSGRRAAGHRRQLPGSACSLPGPAAARRRGAALAFPRQHRSGQLRTADRAAGPGADPGARGQQVRGHAGDARATARAAGPVVRPLRSGQTLCGDDRRLRSATRLRHGVRNTRAERTAGRVRALFGLHCQRSVRSRAVRGPRRASFGGGTRDAGALPGGPGAGTGGTPGDPAPRTRPAGTPDPRRADLRRRAFASGGMVSADLGGESRQGRSRPDADRRPRHHRPALADPALRRRAGRQAVHAASGGACAYPGARRPPGAAELHQRSLAGRDLPGPGAGHFAGPARARSATGRAAPGSPERPRDRGAIASAATPDGPGRGALRGEPVRSARCGSGQAGGGAAYCGHRADADFV